jgi:hypothetical protein
MKTSPKTFGVLLAGFKHPEYFEADGWQENSGLVRLIRGTSTVAAFSVRNLIAIIDLSAKSHLDADEVKKRLQAPSHLAGEETKRQP